MIRSGAGRVLAALVILASPAPGQQPAEPKERAESPQQAERDRKEEEREKARERKDRDRETRDRNKDRSLPPDRVKTRG